jgi:cob(I)alamin adenosyltransferase
MRIYTRTGDDGTTGLFGGARTSKADLRVEAYGTVDEANAAIGLARAAGLPPATDAVLSSVQSHLFDVGSVLASAPGKAPPTSLGDDAVVRLERAIDDLEASLPPLATFVLPGGSEPAVRLHVARTVVRRAERLVVRLAETANVPGVIVRFLNRLSDYLFEAARDANARAGVADVPWLGRKA